MSRKSPGQSKDSQDEKLVTKFEEIQLVYRNRTPVANRPKINSPQQAYKVLLKSWNMDQIELLEECKVLLLDRSLRLMSMASVSKGGMSGTVVDPKVVFSLALKRRASSIILAHNHPSQNLRPSKADLDLTRNFIEAGKILQIPLEDHLIVTREGFHSIATNGCLIGNDI